MVSRILQLDTRYSDSPIAEKSPIANYVSLYSVHCRVEKSRVCTGKTPGKPKIVTPESEVILATARPPASESNPATAGTKSTAGKPTTPGTPQYQGGQQQSEHQKFKKHQQLQECQQQQRCKQ